jgi:phosphosulfolactate synthase
MLNKYEVSFVEVSDGSLNISHKKKCDLIRTFSRTGTVLSEIGSKDKDHVHVLPPYRWIELMEASWMPGQNI